MLAGIRSISETTAVLGESEIGLAEIVLYVVPAPGADGSAAVAAARERLGRCRPTSGRGGSKWPTICRAQRPARSSASSFTSNCGVIRIDEHPLCTS
jgi:hypothetical protein